MKNLKTFGIILFTIIIFTNAFSQQKSTSVIIKSITCSNNIPYVIKNGKIVSEGIFGNEGYASYSYNKEGLLDLSGKLTYNADGTLASLKRISKENLNDPNSKINIYTYSTKNISEKVYQAANLSVVLEENIFTIQDGLIVSKTKVGGTENDTYKYDASGNMIFWRSERTDAKGFLNFHERTYTYDDHPSIQNILNNNFYGKKMQLTVILMGGGFHNYSYANNKLTCIDNSNRNFNKTAKTKTTNFTYTYAPNGYPASVVEDNGNIKKTTKYTY